MSDDKPVRRSEFSASLNGIPSALDEVQFRQVLKDFGNIEAKGLQQRATASEIARVTAHVREIYVHNAIDGSRMRDMASKELTSDEYARFDGMLTEIENEFHQAQIRASRTGFDQMNENIRKSRIPSSQPHPVSEFIGGLGEGITGVFKPERKGRKQR